MTSVTLYLHALAVQCFGAVFHQPLCKFDFLESEEPICCDGIEDLLPFGVGCVLPRLHKNLIRRLAFKDGELLHPFFAGRETETICQHHKWAGIT